MRTLRFPFLILLALTIGACSIFSTPTPEPPTPTLSPPSTSTPAPTDTPVPPTPTVTPTLSPTATSTPAYPPEGYGPQNFPPDVNPLTGLKLRDADLLARRPVAIKVSIVPRTSSRPPWGLSSADLVYDYYQNDGYTRFHAIFYGEDASQVGSIRSARFPDDALIRMYKSIFAYGSADPTINGRLFSAEYSKRLVLEGGMNLCPPTAADPLCRFDPSGFDILLGGTSQIHAYATTRGVDDIRQNLDGMSFRLDSPQGGVAGETAAVRYSGDSYTRWEYDPDNGLYLRLQDDVYDVGGGEAYAPLIDRVNEQQISASNVVVLLMPHSYFRPPPAEMVEISFVGGGQAYAFRDGQVYKVQWAIPSQNNVLYLTYPDGSPFPFKPGNTWFQVIGQSSVITEPEAGAWRFEFRIP